MIRDDELDLLGIAVADCRVTGKIKITGAEFETPMAGAAWDAIRRLSERGHGPFTPTAIAAEAKSAGARIDVSLIVDSVGRSVPALAEPLAEQIAEAHRLRMMDANFIRGRQMVAEGIPSDQIKSEIGQRLNLSTEAEADTAAMVTLDEFVDQVLPPQEWVIPNLLAKGDRMVLTGLEGGGKTTLQRQFAVCAAAGLHPFTLQPAPPKKVLVLDAENPVRIMVKRFGELRDGIRARGKSCEDRLMLNRFPQGLDLSKSRDRLLLHNQCMLTNPDLLVIGPAYKLYVGGSNTREEDLARQVTSVLDGLREEFGFALILEHHSGHGQAGQKRDTRPIGSSLWRRWPEFGLGLSPTGNFSRDRREVDVVHWRGGRDDRPWPEQLESGNNGIPWVVADPIAYMAAAS